MAFLWAILFLLLLSICCALFYTLAFITVTVENESMAPTFSDGDRLLVVRAWLARKLRRGQVVILHSPTLSSQYATQTIYLKRVVALGDTSYTTQSVDFIQDQQEVGHETTWHIPKGMVFVQGDNLRGSIDSRVWGPVSQQLIIGIVLCKLPTRSSSQVQRQQTFTTPHVYMKRRAPVFSAISLSGETFHSSDFAHRKLLLLFIANTKLSRAHLPTLIGIHAQVQPYHITTLFVCDGDRQQAQALIETYHIQAPVLIAPQEQHPLIHAYNLPGTPAYCFINTQGVIESLGLINSFAMNWQTLLSAWLHASETQGEEE